METELASLSATLRGIQSLHQNIARDSRRPQPFTNALLNNHDLPVLSYIRDADPVEAGLFHYATPQPQQQSPSQAGQQASQVQPSAHEMTAEEQYALLNPKGPEIKQHVPPTPLRRPTPAGGKPGQDDYDASTLLLAAQKLLDNYHKAPRARKHIKALQKRNTEGVRLIVESESALAEAEAAAAQRGISSDALHQSQPLTPKKPQSASSTVTNTATATASKQDTRIRRRREYEALQAELQRDDLDCFALEQLIKELHGERDVLMSPRKIAASSRIVEGPPPSRLGGGAGGRGSSALGARKGPRMSSLAMGGGAGSSSALGGKSRRSALSSSAAAAAAAAIGGGSLANAAGPFMASVTAAADLATPSLRGSIGPGGARPYPSTPRAGNDSGIAGGPTPRRGLSALDRTAERNASVPPRDSKVLIEATEEEEEEDEDENVGDETVSPTPIAARNQTLTAGSSVDNSVLSPTPSKVISHRAQVSTAPAAVAQEVQPTSQATPTASSSSSLVGVPASTPELERISTNINNAFGDVLRFVSSVAPSLVPAATASNFQSVYSALHALAYPLRNGTGYASVLSSKPMLGPDAGVTDDGATDAGSVALSATGTASLSAASPPSPTQIATAFVLLQLLDSAPSSSASSDASASHAVEFAALKLRTDEWWGTQGREEYLGAKARLGGSGSAGSSDASGGEASMRGEQLATKAVYALVAKRLLRIRRAGGSAAVGFA
ncbi:hypothetical protein OC845_002630 [Tilletia horrida]|nr:hypothetical protein OC845_002630 [Tilletia horrida]